MSAVEAVQEDEPNAWWTTLKHQGVLLSPIILEEIFSDGPPEIGEREYEPPSAVASRSRSSLSMSSSMSSWTSSKVCCSSCSVVWNSRDPT